MNAVAPLETLIRPITAMNAKVALLDAKPGFNFRIVFRPTPMEELVENIRLRGVVQSIAIRRRTDQPDRFWIMAGERRVRACRILGIEDIPARLFDVTEEEAHEIAAAENIRDDLSFGEEALAARRMMIARKGDRLEAARRLGWGLKKFDARLLLSQATEDVLVALAEERIELGHAELLSSCPEVTQQGTLKAILERRITVAQLKTQLAAFTLDLSTACFDLSGCANCLHNTTRQSSLFEQNVGEGRCTNRPCFQLKTDQHLEELRPALRDRYPSVRSDKECDPEQVTIVLRADVGDAQYEGGCAQCPNFGCILSTRIGEAGRVTEDVCFDLTCHTRKVREFKGADPGVVTAVAAPAQRQRPVAPPAQRPARTASATRPTPAPPAEEDWPGPVSRKLQDRIDAVHRRAAAAEVASDPKMTQVYAILALLGELRMLQSTRGDPLQKRGIERPHTGDVRPHLIAALYESSPEVLSEILCELAGLVAGRTSDSAIHLTNYGWGTRRTLAVMQVDLARHFTLDADFLSAHTKAQILALLTEAGFPKYYNGLDQMKMKRLMEGKHADIVRLVLETDFDFKGFVPALLKEDIK